MKTGNKLKTYVVMSILLTFSFYLLPVKAANLLVQSADPIIEFDDTGEAGTEWRVAGDQGRFALYNNDTAANLLYFTDTADMQLDMSATTFRIQDEIGFTIVSIARDAPPLSLDIQPNGDVSLAGGDVFIDASTNRLGIGTNVPSEDLEIQSTTPGIVFDDTSSNSADWYVGNLSNDFALATLVNATGGPSFTQILTLDAETGYIGMNVDTPTAPLHVARSDGLARILVEETNGAQGPRDLFEIKNNGNPEFRMTNSGNGNSWLFSAGLRFVVKNNAGVWVSRITSTGDMEITGSLTTTGGTCGGGGCDLVFQPDTRIESIEEHAASMWANRYLPAVGPTLENAPFNLTEKTGGMLNELEKAHIYIEQLNNRLAEQDQRHETSIQRYETSVQRHETSIQYFEDAAKQLKLENQVLLDRQQAQYAELKAMITLQMPSQNLVASLE